jgi:large subunit ribosomal protein L18
MDTKTKQLKRERRKRRVRAKIFGTPDKPRLSVFRSNRYVVAQLIDDLNSKTIAYATTKEVKGATNSDKSKAVGALIAEKAKSKNISKAVFDRNGYVYTGSVASVAYGAREGGLKF